MQKPESLSNESLDKAEGKALERNRSFLMTSAAYALEHATRPSTIGFVLSCSPIALLSWEVHPFELCQFVLILTGFRLG